MNLTDKIYRSLLRIRPAILGQFIKKIINYPSRVLQTSNGNFLVDVVSQFGAELSLRGIYEPDTVEFLLKSLKPGDTFVDVGANQGYFSVIASRLVGEKGRVILIEPQKRLQKLIAKNLELNKCVNVKVLQVAISDKKDDQPFYLSPDTNTGSSSLMTTTKYPLKEQVVESWTLSDVFEKEKLNNCSLLKVDVEGWEREVILGSKHLFEQNLVRAIIIEFHPRLLEKRGVFQYEIINFLLGCGYAGSGSQETRFVFKSKI